MTPPTNIKKYRKWKKEQYQLIEYDLKQKGDIIEKVSPFYSAATGDKRQVKHYQYSTKIAIVIKC